MLLERKTQSCRLSTHRPMDAGAPCYFALLPVQVERKQHQPCCPSSFVLPCFFSPSLVIFLPRVPLSECLSEQPDTSCGPLPKKKHCFVRISLWMVLSVHNVLKPHSDLWWPSRHPPRLCQFPPLAMWHDPVLGDTPVSYNTVLQRNFFWKCH